MKKSLYLLLSLFLSGFGRHVSAGDLLAWWNFDTESHGKVIDVQAGQAGHLLGGAALTEPGSGRTGGPTDRAIRFGTAQERLHVVDATFLNATGDTNAISIAFWQHLDTVRNQTTFFANAATLPRAFSLHSPWSDGTIYWDTAGCCDGGTQRVSINPGAEWTGVWHHVVLIKSGDLKLIYLNGEEILNGFSSDPLSTDFTELFIGNSSNLGEAVNGRLDDVAIFQRELTPEEVVSLAEGASPASLDAPNDTDGDGLPDAWELRFAANLTVLTPAADPDSDGLTNAQEFALGTKPTVADTDGDGLADGIETNTGIWVGATDTGTDPLRPDTDNDGLPDGAETNTGTFLNVGNTGTNPHVTDSDGDGFPDGVEVNYGGSNPTSNLSRPLRAGQLDLLAYWSFDDASDPEIATDAVRGFVGALRIGNDSIPTIYSEAGEGHTGEAGDRAIDFGFAGGNATGIVVEDGGFLQIAAAQNQVAISFWQKLYDVVNSTSFKGISPTSTGVARGLSGHATWSDNSYYWDTAGCCDGTQRIAGPNDDANLIDEWHHFVFQKNGDLKEIWVDGVLKVSGVNTGPLPLDFTTLHIGSDGGGENIAGLIDDFAVYADALTPEQINLLASGTAPNSPQLVPPNTDTDGDGMPDAYETAHGLNPAVDDREGDLDGDGATNFVEYVNGTLPNNPDTDGDGLRDGVETNTGVWVSLDNTGTNPLLVDSDGDGLPDGLENPTLPFTGLNQPGTDPNKVDSDGDSFPDPIEIEFGSNPTLASSTPLDPNQLDLLAYWSFDDASDPAKAIDAHRGIAAEINEEVLYTDGGGGRSGEANDRALDYGFGQGSQAVTVLGARWLNLAAGQNQVAVSFWQNLHQVISSTVFKFTSPSSTGVERGMSAHATWGDDNFYFDSAGCCDTTQRLSGPNDVNLVEEWHHFVFQKNGDIKEIWVDGELKLSGVNAAPLPTDLADLYIGTSNGGESILGLLDDFAIFADALTPAQIGRLAAGESPLALIGGSAASPISFTAVNYNPAANQITLTWTSQPGATYTLESSQTLATWPIEINDSIASGGTSTTYVHSLATFPGGAPPALYYRVKQN